MKARVWHLFWQTLLLLAFLSIAIVGFTHLNSEKLSLGDAEKRYLPKASAVKLLSVGHNESIASLLWINALVEYGGSLFGEAEFKWFSHYGNLVTTLDSLQYIPYYFIASTANEKSDATVELLSRAYRVYPHDWRMSLYYAVYVANKYQQYNKAAQIMDIYQNTDSVPEYIKRIPTTFRRKALPTSEALMQLLSDYLQPQNTGFRKGLEGQIRKSLNIEAPQDSTAVAELLQQTAQGSLDPGVAFRQLNQMQKPAKDD